ncbi:MAG TPA: HlyD family efflux transporter periplasmic adaptor subunit [Gammaproteobacteria bacterium]|nr:HlyD family efflux transporter periplasmic adaptor subunit [Gammaproteobacteria bacterium]
MVRPFKFRLSQLPMLDAEIENLSQRRQALEAETQGKWLTELTDTETKLADLNQDLIKAQNRYTLQQLAAPVAGTVQQLALHTIGGVVTPAQELMRIVPEEDSIQIEAWVENKDIGFVHDGQNTEIKVETFPYTKYGTLTGRLIKVSTDAITEMKELQVDKDHRNEK